MGSANPRKLTDKDVAKIRELAATVPHSAIAERFGIHRKTVHKVVTAGIEYNDDSAIVIVEEYETGKITREEAMRRLIEIGYTEQKASDIVGGAQRRRT